MDHNKDTSFVRRRVSQLRVLARLMEHELDAGQGKDIVIDRDLGESMLDTLEIFIEDLDVGNEPRQRVPRQKQPEKAAVTRLN